MSDAILACTFVYIEQFGRLCWRPCACFSLYLLCRSVSGSDADLLPTAACQLSLFVTSYIAMRVYCEANDVQLTSVAAVAGLSLGDSSPPAQAIHERTA